ncbi:methyltransferase domain-containing protein [Paenibacillus sp. DYY-L-2]|uniref:class I SAM-dependent methyltransferase n=1 Tax=Paenibacillus sp. DYY-L-2 TaxID=3447013 RepID=UPI003F503967
MNRIPFDQFQRYNNVQKIINDLRIRDEKLKILEVGANEHQNLEKFLPTDVITYLDINLPEELRTNPKYILGDATQMEFEDNTYDIVVALDVFEHIPADKRKKFIDELSRVSSRYFVITAPFSSDQVKEAEHRLETLYFNLFKERFIWLEEHATNGLPDLSEIEEYLTLNQRKFKVIPHGSIDIWEKIMGIHFFAAKNPELINYREEIDLYYNSHIFDYDYTDNSYRKIIIGSENLELDLDMVESKINTGIPESLINKLEELERGFFELLTYKNMESTKQILIQNKFDLSNQLSNITEKEQRTSDWVQIYIDTGSGYSEENSLKVKMCDHNSSNYLFNLTSFGDIASVRIDPSRYSGVFRVRNIKVDGTISKANIQGNYVLELNNEIYAFDKDDPCILINFDNKEKISCFEFESERINDVLLVNELKSLRKNYYSILEEVNKTKELNDSLKQEINEMNNCLYEMKSQEAELRNQIKDKDSFLLMQENDIQILKEKLTREEERNQYLSMKEKQLGEELLNIKTSKSWRIINKVKSIINR